MGWKATVPVMAALAGLSLAATQGLAKETVEQPEKPVFATSLAGAFLAARTAEADNDFDDAIAFYQRALAFDPANETMQQSLLLALIASGRFNDALPVAEKLKTVAEAERYSRLALGVDSIRAKQYRSATNYFKLALSSDLDNLITGILTGWAMAGSGDTQGAIEHIVRLDGPPWFEVFRNYHAALVADMAGDPSAGERYQKVIDDRASAGAAPDTWLRAVDAYAAWAARNGRQQKAGEVVGLGLEVSAGRPSTVALKEAIASGKTVPPLVRTPQEGGAEILLNVAAALNRSGGESFVRLYLQYALALDPDNDIALATLGSVAEKLGESQIAIDTYSRVPANSPFRRLAELQLGLNLADLDRYDEAVEHLKAAIASDETDTRAWLSLGGVYAAKEDFASAAALYDEAVAKIGEPKPEDWTLFYRRGIAYERTRQWDKAEPNFRKALELFPDQPQVLNYLGYSWVDMNMNLEEGLEMIRKAVDLRPQDGYIVDSLGWAYYRLGRYDEAVEELEKAVRLRPEDPTINDHLGDAYWQVGRRLEATFQWSHALALDPDEDLKPKVQAKLRSGLPDEKAGEVAEPDMADTGGEKG
ncbi:MAG: tetratricopeptide repeat protein [Zhengella sp.]